MSNFKQNAPFSNMECRKLQALVYDILPPTTAISDYDILPPTTAISDYDILPPTTAIRDYDILPPTTAISDYDILPPTTAIRDYDTGLEKRSALVLGLMFKWRQ